jgi:hypothetical protein
VGSRISTRDRGCLGARASTGADRGELAEMLENNTNIRDVLKQLEAET